MLYKLPCKLVTVQLEDKKTPEITGIQAFKFNETGA
jgi:hypothetical protein